MAGAGFAPLLTVQGVNQFLRLWGLYNAPENRSPNALPASSRCGPRTTKGSGQGLGSSTFEHSFALCQLRLSVARRSAGTPFGRLSGYHGTVAAAVPTGKLYPLVGSKPVVRYDLAFWRMRVAPTPQGVYINKPQLSLPMQPGHEVIMCQPSEWTGTALTADGLFRIG
jgi:hypothetical protein